MAAGHLPTLAESSNKSFCLNLEADTQELLTMNDDAPWERFQFRPFAIDVFDFYGVGVTANIQ
jgi:hypothetical protein